MSLGFSSDTVVDLLTIAVVLIDGKHRIRYCNHRFLEWFGSKELNKETLIGQDFYQAINYPTFVDGCFAPFHYAPLQDKPTCSTLSYTTDETDPNFNAKFAGRRFEALVSCLSYDINAANPDEVAFMVELKDTSEMNRYEQQLATLRTVGNDLAFCTNEKLHESVNDLKTRFKQTIQRQMRDVLNYDVFEIRTLNKETNELIPFSSFGVDRTAISRRLYASSNNNGITGFVASSGEVYTCNDTKNDPLYIQGAINAKSSITVPLVFNNEIIGVCNVESLKSNAFSSQDRVFLELYAKDLAFAIHLLEYTRNKDSFVRQTCNRILHNDLDSAFYSVLESVCETVSALRGSSNHSALSEKVDRLVKDCYELRELFEQSTHTISTTPIIPPQDMPEEGFPSFDISDHLKWESLKATLSKMKALLVAKDRQTLACYGDWLKLLGCRVDYVNSSKMAILSLKHVKYDVVICERNPDGSYFAEVSHSEAHNESIGLNKFHFSRYDIHEGEEYFIPADNNPEDESERQRIYREIYEEGKLDAYFLLKEIYALNLHPLFILASNEGERYDPTHVRPNVNKLRRSAGYSSNTEPTFLLMTENDKVWKVQKNFFQKLYLLL